ncbi:ABC transporter ATP-binding protein [Thalassoroseus pseudoceratinae]|uniref:ABC transporter ATP-binding protein n=1 Tax=Thalassoroseus pseudoceratinae TaxID=2713176 RepID=UPI00142089B9|nr:sn-glycerol-3-phosphate ABC transporter ATP-binding protein UgpC [Thalassoroseus pseudoceratinae]
MASVTFENLSKTFTGQTPAVNDVSLEIADGEFLVLVGPSGCGKSTLLRMIAGLETPSAGTIRIGDRIVNDVPPKDRNLAMVFQNYALYPHMSVRQNLGFGLKLQKVPKTEIRSRTDDVAKLLQITDLLDRKPGQISGGQRQRVAVGRAIMRQPAVFLFDEPLSNLDASLRGEMRRELAALHRRLQTTMIYVTHDQVEAMTLGDRIVVMKGGIVQQVGPPLALYHHPVNRFVAGFLGSPPMNLIEGTLDSKADTPTFRFGSQSVPIPESVATTLNHTDAPLTLGVRPEHLRLQPNASTNNVVRMAGVVEEIQPLGSESLVHVLIENQSWIAKVPSTDLTIGASTNCEVSADHITWFDTSGIALPNR